MEERKCDICGSTKNVRRKKNGVYKGFLLCAKHYEHAYKYNKMIERTIYDSNKIIEYEDYAEIEMYDKHGNITGYTQIDKEDIEQLSQHKWHISNTGYATTRLKDTKKLISLHKLLMKSTSIIDHLDRNKLNNRKSNLVVSNHSYNNLNRDKLNRNTSGVVGVNWNKTSNKWESRIHINKQVIRLGYFKEFKDAVIARLEFEKTMDNPPQKHLFKEYGVI